MHHPVPPSQPHHARRSHNPTVLYRFAGLVQGCQGEQVEMHVDAAHGRARRFLDHFITLDLHHSRLQVPDGSPLQIGDRISVYARMPRSLAEVPQIIQPGRVEEIEPSWLRAAA